MFGQGSARFRTTDFFGIVLPGAYLVCELALVVLLFVGPNFDIEDAKNLGSLWAPILVLLLFVSYLIGSVFRTWTVDDTDDKFAALFPEYSDEVPGETAFPYRERLKRGKDAVCLAMSPGDFEVVFRQYARAKTKNLDQLSPTDKETALRDYLPPFGLARSPREQGKFGGEPEQPGGWPVLKPSLKHAEPWVDDITILHRGNHIFNFWKAVLCVNSASGFEFAEACEARTRFFFGMLYAARWSLRIMCVAAAALFIRLILRTSAPNVIVDPGTDLLLALLKAVGFVAALVIVLIEFRGDRRSRRAKDLERRKWDPKLSDALREAKKQVERVLEHPPWNLTRAARKTLADLTNLGQNDANADDPKVEDEKAEDPKVIADELLDLMKNVQKVDGVEKAARETDKDIGSLNRQIGAKIIKSVKELRGELNAKPRGKVFRTRMWFWVPLVTEIVLTPLLLVNAHVCLRTEAPIERVVLIFLLTFSTALLFLFLAKRLRLVRAREMRAVYINHVALVLASYRAEKKDPA
jgi:hypothetical protein